VAVGFGGYASAPVLYAAEKKGVPAVIQEQNSFAGLTNKILGRKADRICVAHEGMEAFFPAAKIRLTGNPVRAGIADAPGKREEGLQYFGLAKEKPVMLVLGGSLGSRTINESVAGHLELIAQEGVQLVWQCGKYYYKDLLENVKDRLNEGQVLSAFISDMQMAYAVADVVISRAGALSVSELCLAGKPVIFVPSPNVAEDHQTKNAEALVEKDAAEMISDHKAREQLVPAGLKLLKDQSKRRSLAENIKTLARPDATEDIAKEIIALMQ